MLIYFFSIAWISLLWLVNMSSRMLFAMLCIPNPVAIAICFSFLWVSLDIRITSVFFNFRSSRYSENFFPQTLLSSVFGEDCTEGLDSGFSICSGWGSWTVSLTGADSFTSSWMGCSIAGWGIVLYATLPICWISCSFLLALCSKSFLMAADDVLSLLVAIALFSYMVTD